MPLSCRGRRMGGGEMGGASPGLVAHKYWRLQWLDHQGAPECGLGHVAFMDADSNVLSTGGTATHSSAAGGTATQAFTRPYDTGNWWCATSGCARQAWLSYEFTNDVLVSKIAVAGTATVTRIPGMFVMRYSDDGSTWYSAWYGGFDLGTAYTLDYATAQSKDVWRLDIDAVDGGDDTSLAELWFNEVAEVDDARYKYRGYAWTENPVETNWSRSAFDGDTDTRWFSQGDLDKTSGNYLLYAKDASGDIAEVAIRAHPTAPANSPKDFRISYWDHLNLEWVQVKEVTGETGWTNGEVRRFVIV